MDQNIEKAVKILKNGGIVIFPTDTAFGIGSRIDSKKAVERLFKIRKRPRNQAVPILVNSVEMAKDYVRGIPTDVMENLIKPFWPGALTIILNADLKKVPPLVRGNGSTIGIRMPNNLIIRSIISKIGVPILGPSANFHGDKTPYDFEELNKNIIKNVDFVLRGKTIEKSASTVIDCTKMPWKVLRQGAIRIQNYNSKIKNVLYIDTSANNLISVVIKMGENRREMKVENVRGSQILLKTIEKLLKKNKLKLKDLTEIRVNTGPGSFTGLRVGIAVANALGFALKIPVNAKEGGGLAEASYQDILRSEHDKAERAG